MDHNNSTDNRKKPEVFININSIDKLAWGQTQADKLKKLRGKSRRIKLQQKTETLGLKVSHQYIQQLENPSASSIKLKSGQITVSVRVVETLAEALGVDITYFYSSMVFFTE